MSDPKSKAVPAAAAKAAPPKVVPPKAVPPAKPDPKGAPAEAAAPRGRFAWMVGWVLAPGSIIGVLFGGGALVGAHFHDSWFSRTIVWVVELFA